MIKASVQSRRHPGPSVAVTGLALLPFDSDTNSGGRRSPTLADHRSLIAPSALVAMKMKGGEQTGGMSSIFVEGEGVICIYARSCNFQDHVGPDVAVHVCGQC